MNRLVGRNWKREPSVSARVVSSSSVSRKRSWSSRVANVGTGDGVERWLDVWLWPKRLVDGFKVLWCLLTWRTVGLYGMPFFTEWLLTRKTASSACSSWEVWTAWTECWCRCLRGDDSSINSVNASPSSLPMLSMSSLLPLAAFDGTSNTLLPSGISIRVSSRTGEATLAGSMSSSDRVEPVGKNVN